MTQRKQPEPITHENAVGLESLLRFNAERLAAIRGDSTRDDKDRKFVRGRITELLEQLSQCGQTAS